MRNIPHKCIILSFGTAKKYEGRKKHISIHRSFVLIESGGCFWSCNTLWYAHETREERASASSLLVQFDIFKLAAMCQCALCVCIWNFLKVSSLSFIRSFVQFIRFAHTQQMAKSLALLHFAVITIVSRQTLTNNSRLCIHTHTQTHADIFTWNVFNKNVYKQNWSREHDEHEIIHKGQHSWCSSSNGLQQPSVSQIISPSESNLSTELVKYRSAWKCIAPSFRR